RRRGNDLEPAGMVGRGCSKQRAVEPVPGLEQVDQRQLWPQAELEGDVAELDVEVDQAGLAPAAGLIVREAQRELAGERGGTDTADALDDADQLGAAGIGRAPPVDDLVGDRGKRGLEVLDVERQRNDVV